MFTSHSDTSEIRTPAVLLGMSIRAARQKKGMTIASLAEQIGRTREWLNRVELGYSDEGVHKPPSSSDIQMLLDILSSNFRESPEHIKKLAASAEDNFNALRRNGRQGQKGPIGKLTQVEIIMGEEQVGRAIRELIQQQHSDAIIRNTGVKNIESYKKTTPDRNLYAEELGKFLIKNPNALFKRVQYVASPEHLKIARAADQRLAAGRKLDQLHNVKVKFRKENPFHLHVLIGQREAILTFPQSSAHSGSNIALLVRDKQFVEALRTWYDEVLWEGNDASTMVNFGKFDESFNQIKSMYGF